MARWAALVQFREKIADLKEAFKARQTYLEASIPPLVRTMIDLSALKEPFAHTSAPATSFAIGKAA